MFTPLDQGVPDAEHVSYVDRVIGHAFDREVLAELSVTEVIPVQLVPPVLVVSHRVGIGRFVRHQPVGS